jgi:anaerobic selenocysteine-containing dehydrogenase
MHPDDAVVLNLRDGERVSLTSRQGRGWSILRVTDIVPIGSVFMPMHWADLWSVGVSPNDLTTDSCDPISREPALKRCAVHVARYTCLAVGIKHRPPS